MALSPDDNLKGSLTSEQWAELLAADELDDDLLDALGSENRRRLESLRGAIGAAAEFHEAPTQTSESVETEILNAATKAYDRYFGEPKIQSTVVMFTDMAGSTEFAEKTSVEEAREKQKTHNDLLFPLIDQYDGIVIKTIGDAIMAIFDRTVDAARCAVQMMRRLFEYNRANYPQDEDRQIRIRAGIHTGKAMIYREQGRLDVTGSAANVAARVESGGDKQPDQILLSDQAFAQLIPHQDELPCEFAGQVTAKGVGALRLLRLRWHEDADNVEFAPLQLAAETAKSFVKQMSEAQSTRGIHCLFVDPTTRQGSVRPLFVRLTPSATPSIQAKVETDKVMQGAAVRAIESAFEVMHKIGFPEARVSDHQIEWWIEGPAATYTGASIGLAIALATVAAYTEVGIDVETVVTGAIEGDQVTGVEGILEKWQAVKDRGFDRMIVPAGNLLNKAISADDASNLVGVATIKDAVVGVLGSALGLSKMQLSSLASSLSSHNMPVQIELNIEAAVTERKITIVDDLQRSWRIDDAIQIRAVPSQDCHLALVNIDSNGELTILHPSSIHPDSVAAAGVELSFPGPSDRFKFKLTGPAGTERIIVLASSQPWRLTPADMNQTGSFAQPALSDWLQLAEQFGGELVGMKETELFVVDQSDHRGASRSIARSTDDSVAMLLSPRDTDFRSAKLDD